jgi:serine/threonine-protein kinase
MPRLMAVSLGSSVGPYTVVGLLGQGGMGEVYRAHDGRLKRDVALKILPVGFSSDADRVARFQREAEVLAALNHPGIAAIYGVEDVDGTRALVLELVDGETLADRIGRGPIPVDETVSLARQIADALDYAHERGVLHRDLKPANIKVTPDGKVKLLDFGLATALGAAASGSGASPQGQAPTITTPAFTQAGVLLGTAAYMSPEQARGKQVDRRADIWAFGCVLFEMLTGTRAFQGETISDTLAAVLKSDPEWAKLPAAIPGGLDALVRKCLTRDLKDRVRDIADARWWLDQATGPVIASILSPVSPAPRRSRVKGFVAILIAGLAAGGISTWFVMRVMVDPPVQTRLALVLPTGGQVGTSTTDPDLAVSPDGRSVAYTLVDAAGERYLYLQRLDEVAPTQVRTRSDPRTPFFSPDGRWLGFFEERELRKAPTSGGPAVSVADVGDVPRGAAWASDGSIVVSTLDTATGLLRVPEEGGTPEVLTTPDASRGEYDHRHPEVLPGSGAVLFTIVTGSAGSEQQHQVGMLDLRTRKHRTLIRAGSFPRYAASGHIVYVAEGALFAVAFDAGRLEVTSDPVRIPANVTIKGSGAANVGVAGNGTLVYMTGRLQTSERTMVWVDQTGHETPLTVPPRPYVMPRVSPEGTRVAVEIAGDVWMLDVARGTLDRLAADVGRDSGPIWSPDGQRIAYHAGGRDGGPGIHIRAADSTGGVERIANGTVWPLSWSPDGRSMVFIDLAGARRNTTYGGDLGLVTLGGPERPRPLVATAATENDASVSPNGRWLAYATNESEQNEIVVRPFPDVDAGRWRISTNGGDDPVWARDGRRLFYRQGRAMMAVAVSAGSPSTWGRPERLFEHASLVGPSPGPRAFDLGPDGRFLLVKGSSANEGEPSPQIIVAQHWLAELRRLMEADDR